MNEVLDIGKSHLNEFQMDIFIQSIEKKSGGLSLTMGSGKTLISIVTALEQTKVNNKPILVIASKTLLETWVQEINKFFGNKLKYVVFHSEYIKNINSFELKDDIKIVITTPEVISKYYKQEGINDKFIRQVTVNEGRFNQHVINVYNRPEKPYSVIKIGGAIIYSNVWGSLIVDEVQNFTKIKTIKCQSISSICSIHRWALSGTIFNEPTTERILGYHLIIDDKDFPRTLPETEKIIKNREFKGINKTLVCRKSNPVFVKPKVNEFIISHELSPEEKKLYLAMKIVVDLVNKKIKMFKIMNDTGNTRKFSSYLLAMISYLRQCTVCSLLPISSIAIDLTDFKGKSELSKMLMDEIKKLDLNKWMDNEDSAKSTRIMKSLEVINKHSEENIVVFGCYRMFLDVFKEFLPKNRKFYIITSTISSKKRSKILDKFQEGNGNILLLTYDIGSEGLNIQKNCHTVLLTDFYWNNGKTSQSIARVLRYGQLSKEVNI